MIQGTSICLLYGFEVALPRLSILDVDSQSDRPPNTRGALKSVAASLNPKAENRNPKEARNPKSRKTGRAGGWPGQRLKSFSDFGLRISFGFRFSAFGFQGRLRRVRCYRSDFRAALPARSLGEPHDIPGARALNDGHRGGDRPTHFRPGALLPGG